VLPHFSHLNAKLLTPAQHNDEGGMLAVNLCRIATQGVSHDEDFLVYQPGVFTEFQEKAPDGK
jgi:hypothetical protein